MSNRALNLAWALSLPPTDKLVLVALANCANKEGKTWISVRSDGGKRDLIAMTGLSERAVQGALNRLDEAGHIQRTPVPGRCTIYDIHPRSRCGASTPAADAGAPAADAGAPAADAPVTSLNDIHTSLRESKRPQKKKARFAGQALPLDWEPLDELSHAAQQIANDWPCHRRAIEIQRFRNHFVSRGEKRQDWQAEWDGWVINSVRFETKVERNERAETAAINRMLRRIPAAVPC